MVKDIVSTESAHPWEVNVNKYGDIKRPLATRLATKNSTWEELNQEIAEIVRTVAVSNPVTSKIYYVALYIAKKGRQNRGFREALIPPILKL